jgi:hypothetical protein
VPGYDFSELARIIEQLRPSVLAVELTADALAARSPQATKREYPEVVYPLLERFGFPAVPLEPDEPLYGSLVRAMRESFDRVGRTDPEIDLLFDSFNDRLPTAHLRPRWRSAAAVNDAVTDAVFEAKHVLQDVVYGADHAEAWAAWNEHFAQRIGVAAMQRPGKRVVVLVGVEHGYWLRARVREMTGLRLENTEELVRS